MGYELGGPVFLDQEGSFSREYGVRGVPHWYLISANHEVLDEEGGLPSDADPSIIALFFRGKLGKSYSKIF